MAKKRKPAWQRKLLKIAGGQKQLIEKVATAVVVLLVVGVLASAATQKPKPSSPSPSTSTATEEPTAPAQEPTAPAPSSPVAPPQAAAAPSCPSATVMYVNTTRGLNLRTERSLGAAVITKMPHRAAVRAGCREGDWMTVTYDFKTGYALARYLSATAPATTNGGGTQSNFVVTEVAASVSPTGTVIDCEQEYTFTGTIKANGAGTVTYRWERSDGTTETGSAAFAAAGTKTVIMKWLVTNTSSGSAHLRVTSPNEMVTADADYNFIDSVVCT